MIGKRTALRAALSLALCALAGCAELGDVRGQAIAYNVAADDANNQVVLLNIVREGHQRPAEWTSIRQVQGQKALGGGLGLAVPLGPVGGNVFGFTLNPNFTASGQSQPLIDMLDTEEFYKVYLQEIKKDLIGYYQHHEIDLYNYYLFFGAIKVGTGEQHFVANNNPGSPVVREVPRKTFHDFEKLLWAFFVAQLVPERVSEKNKVGPSLTADLVRQRLREIVSATTSKDGLSLGKASEKAKDQYQLKKSEETDRYCFAAEEVPKDEAPAQSRDSAAKIETRPPGDPLKSVRRFALGLRCGATSEQRQEPDKLMKENPKLKESVEAPDITVLDTTECGSPALNPPLKTDLTKYLKRYCDFVREIKRIAKINPVPPSAGQLISIKILTRSTDEVLQYLGRVAGFSYLRGHSDSFLVPEYQKIDVRSKDMADNELKGVTACGDLKEFWCYPLLVVKKDATPASAWVSATYEEDAYWVPNDEPGNTFRVFETVHQLIALAKAAKDLPPTAILSVSPLP